MNVRIGHIVWYRTAAYEGGPLTDYAALVVRLVRDGVVDLAVFDPDRMSELSATRNVAHDPRGARPGTWRWPVDELAAP